MLGAFLAGLSCCTIPRLHDAWIKQVKRLQSWLVKLFFAATCGFIVPVRSFASATVFGRAALFRCCGARSHDRITVATPTRFTPSPHPPPRSFPSCAGLGKLASGLLVVPASRANVLTVGLTMAAWGEFAFIVATASLNSGLLDQTTFAALLLAVLASVVIAPVLARAALRGSQRRKERAILDAIKGGRRAGARAGPVVDVSTAPVFFRLRTSAPPTWGLSVRLMDLIRQHGLEARMQRAFALGICAGIQLDATGNSSALTQWSSARCLRSSTFARTSTLRLSSLRSASMA